MSGRDHRPQAEDYLRVTIWTATGRSCVSRIPAVFSGFPRFSWPASVSDRGRANRISETCLGLHPRHDLSYGFDRNSYNNDQTTKPPRRLPSTGGVTFNPRERQVSRTLSAGRRPVKRLGCAVVRA
jgi:hypothetical protein